MGSSANPHLKHYVSKPLQAKRFSALFVVITAFFVMLLPVNACAKDSHITISLFVDTPAHNHIRINEIDKIIHSKHFSPHKGSRTADIDTTPWLKVTWDKSQIIDEKYLINDFPTQAYEDYYLIKDNKVLTTYTIGNSERFDKRPIKHFKFVADVSQADYVLIKVCCNPVVPIYFRMLNEKELNEDYYNSLIKYAVVYSLILSMILYNFFIYFYLREKQYLNYCLYLSAVFFGLVAVSGLGKQFIWPNIVNMEFFYVNSAVFISATSMMFIISFLDKKYVTASTYKLVKVSIIIHWLVVVIYFVGWLFLPQDFAKVLPSTSLQIIVLLGCVINDYMIIRSLLAGDRSARIILFSYTLINIGIVIFILRYNGAIPNLPWTEFIVDIAAVIEALILSLALAQKIKKLRDEKSYAEEQQLSLQKQFSRQLLNVQEEEKKQLGSALHDNFTHQLLILKTNLSKKIGRTDPETKHVDSILNEIRNLSHMVHPYLLEKLGLTDALHEMLEKFSHTYELDINFASDTLNLGKEHSIIVYRIIQESLNNIVKHAQASECVIALKKVTPDAQNLSNLEQTMVEIRIKDDGVGFNTEITNGMGLITIQERCKMLDGTVEIHSDENGTEIFIQFPYHKPDDVFSNKASNNLPELNNTLG